MNETKNKIGIKTYSFVKYIATLSSVLFLISPVFSLLFFWKGFLNQNLQTLNLLTFILFGFGLLFLLTYLAIRMYLFKVSPYKHNKKETRQLLTSFLMYWLTVISCLTYLLIANLSSLSDSLKSYLVILFLSLILIFNTAAAILESFSRLGEQQFLYEEQAKHYDDETVSQAGVVRTSEAQKILATTQDDSSKVVVKDKKVLEDFFEKNLDSEKSKDKD